MSDRSSNYSDNISDEKVQNKIFQNEIMMMLYAFGDSRPHYMESVELMEDIVIDFITEMTHKACGIRNGKIRVEDIIFLIRKDSKKYSRVRDLLVMNEEIKRARKAFDESKLK